MKKTKKQMWVCTECGSIHVQQKAWIGLNDHFIDWYTTGDSGDFWCEDCERHLGVELRVIETVNGVVKVQGYQVENHDQEWHPDMDGGFCLYSLEQAKKMIEDDPSNWMLKAYYKGDFEEPTLMFEGKDPRK